MCNHLQSFFGDIDNAIDWCTETEFSLMAFEVAITNSVVGESCKPNFDHLEKINGNRSNFFTWNDTMNDGVFNKRL
jgi:hypothetical protein